MEGALVLVRVLADAVEEEESSLEFLKQNFGIDAVAEDVDEVGGRPSGVKVTCVGGRLWGVVEAVGL
jgi:hypothetical protein